MLSIGFIEIFWNDNKDLKPLTTSILKTPFFNHVNTLLSALLEGGITYHHWYIFPSNADYPFSGWGELINIQKFLQTKDKRHVVKFELKICSPNHLTMLTSTCILWPPSFHRNITWRTVFFSYLVIPVFLKPLSHNAKTFHLFLKYQIICIHCNTKWYSAEKLHC